jgi:hypothetical protein
LSLGKRTAIIGGSPLRSGTYAFSVMAADSAASSAAQIFSITIGN